MTLLKRFGYYLIGLSIGVVCVAYFFREKKSDFCYMPNCRVLKKLRAKPLRLASRLKVNTHADSLVMVKAKQGLTHGTINFDKSKPRETPCGSYVITYKTIEITVKNCDTLVILEGYKNVSPLN